MEFERQADWLKSGLSNENVCSSVATFRLMPLPKLQARGRSELQDFGHKFNERSLQSHASITRRKKKAP